MIKWKLFYYRAFDLLIFFKVVISLHSVEDRGATMMGKIIRRLCILKSERNPKVKKIREGPSEQERKKKIVLRDRAMNHSGFTGTEPIP